MPYIYKKIKTNMWQLFIGQRRNITKQKWWILIRPLGSFAIQNT